MQLQESHPKQHQGVGGDAISTFEKIPREAFEILAVEIQRKAFVAIGEKRFARRLVPVCNLDRSTALDHEEFPLPETTRESIANLPHNFPRGWLTP